MAATTKSLGRDDLRAVLEFAPYPMLLADRAGAILDANAGLAALLGHTLEQLRSLRVEDLVPVDARARHAEHRNAYIDGSHPRPMGQGRDLTAVHRDGSVIPVEIALKPCRVGETPAVLCTLVDISLRHAAQEALAESEHRYREVTELAPDIIFRIQLRPEPRLEFVSAAVEKVLGYPRAAFDEQPNLWLDVVHAEDRVELARLFTGGGARPQQVLTRLVARDGSIRWLGANVVAVRDATDSITHVYGTARDVTAQRETELRLASTEAQLLQAQKLEAIGRLAGGVAHDFNNLLTVIMSFGSFVASQLSDADPLHEDVGEILSAADRAAALTNQLLAFSRKRTITPRVMDIGQHTHDMIKMLRRLLGEDVELESHLPEDRWLAYLDPGALEQVLVNLAVNARDAMPDGGTLVIDVANTRVREPLQLTGQTVAPGDYISITIEDNGSGMDDDTLSRMFEPFFTTKPAGRGTGLGLATCYGIVQQAGGYIGATSELGRGTRFTLLFPRTGRAGKSDSVPPPMMVSGGHETVLVAEDNAQVRALTTRILKGLGYQVLCAESPGDALLICEQHSSEIGILLTDVVMPRMSGKELATRLLAIRPGLRVLYMSGYTADEIAHHGVLDEGVHLLEKPFSSDDLARALREVIDEAP